MGKIGYVYLTTNLINGKQYVGQHLSDGFDKYYKGSGHAIKAAFDKYGWDNFKCEIICWCSTQTQLNEAEDNYIRLLDTMSPNGYNLKGGGANGRYSKESRKKISEAQKGKPKSEEARKKLLEVNKKYWENEENRKKQSEAHKGKKATEETRKNMSKGLKKCWENEEYRKKQSDSHRNNPKKSKKVYQYRKDGTFVKEWVSVMEIQRVLGYANQSISACCNYKRKTAYDCLWFYEPLY